MFGQQKLALIFKSVSFFAMLLLCSNSFAQANCPNRDCVFPLQAQGMLEPLRGFASETRDPRLQQAVLWNEGPQPIYEYSDTTGRTTCVWNCPQIGETGRPRRQNVNDYRYNRQLPQATSFSEVERKRYSGIGRIECPSRAGSILAGTAFLAGSFSTMATNAHVFQEADGTRINPLICKVAFYNGDGTLRESINIKSVKSRWDEPGKRGDPSNDIALIKLSSESRTPEEFSPIMTAYAYREGEPVSLVGYHLDLGVSNASVMRKSSGVVKKLSETNLTLQTAQRSGVAIARPENLLGADYDSNHGTSGAPVYNAQGQIIGINKGAVGAGGRFNNQDNYNLFIRFDNRFVSDLRAMLAPTT